MLVLVLVLVGCCSVPCHLSNRGKTTEILKQCVTTKKSETSKIATKEPQLFTTLPSHLPEILHLSSDPHAPTSQRLDADCTRRRCFAKLFQHTPCASTASRVGFNQQP